MEEKSPSTNPKFILFLSFLSPLLILLGIYMTKGIYPFGDKSILIMDLSSQYVEFFSGLRHIVHGESSIFYSWSAGMGGGFIGIFAYYMASPLSFLTLLFPEHELTTSLLLLNLLKIGLSGFTFALYLKYLYKRSDLSLVWFSLIYALMSYAIAYSMCLMWLDGLIWLPIVALGVKKLLDEDSPFVLILSLSFLFISTYYIGYMIGLFSFLFFLYHYAKANTTFIIRHFTVCLFKYLGIGLIAACISAWLIVPTAVIMFQGKVGGSSFVPDLTFSFPFVDIVSKLFFGSADKITTFGLPSIYCGMAVLVLVICYYFIPTITKRDKYLSSLMLAVFILSFFIMRLDMAWHIFQYPNWFPHRYAFLFSFMLISIAYDAYSELDSIPPSLIYPLVFVGILVSLFVDRMNYGYLSRESILKGLFLFCLYAFQLIRIQTKPTRLTPFLIPLILLTAFELFSNGLIIVNRLDQDHRYESYTSYQKFIRQVDPLVKYAKTHESGFYRMENTTPRTKNDGIGMGYSGISHYSSSYNRYLNSFLENLGFVKSYISISFKGDTLLSESLLGIKYVLSPNPDIPEHEKIKTNGSVGLFDNPLAMGLGYAIHKDTRHFTMTGNDSLKYQSDLLMHMLNSDKDFLIPVKDTEVTTDHLEVKKTETSATYVKTAQETAHVTFKFMTTTVGPLYADFPSHENNYCDLIVNEINYGKILHTDNNGVHYLGSYHKGQPVEITLAFDNETLSFDNAYFYQLDALTLKQGLDTLKQSQWQLDHFSPLRLSGSIDLKEDQELFTTIPFDKSWRLKVDGATTKIESYQNAFILIPLTPGKHYIELVYRPIGLVTGIILTGCGLLLTLLLWFYGRYKQSSYLSPRKERQISLEQISNGKNGENMRLSNTIKKIAVPNKSHILCIVLCMISVYAVIWSFTGITPFSSNSYNSFALQAEAWLHGHLDLGRDYTHLELAIFNSKYYVSFPPTPSVVLLPLAALFGSHTPDHFVTVLFSLLSGVIAFKISKQLKLRSDRGVFAALFLTIGSNFLFFSFNGGVWFMAQVFSFTFSLLAIYYALSGDMKVHPYLSLFFWALSVGCRPFQIVYLPLLILLLYQKYHKNSPEKNFLDSIKHYWHWGIPALLVATFYFGLNAARFGNPLEFGHNYLPEFLNADYGQFNLAYLSENLKNLFRLPTFVDHKLIFPTANGMAFWLVSPLYLSLMIHLLSPQKLIKDKKMLFVVLLVMMHFLLLCSHRTMGGWHFGNRYTVDALPYVYLLWLMIDPKKTRHKIVDYVLFFLGLSLNLVGTIATYNYWI